MPNGGPDNCGTCWFNARNKGQAYPLGPADNPEPHFCTIRELPIRNDPFYTYCANWSPMYVTEDPGRIEVPIGPVWEGEPREFCESSPDREEVRQTLLELLRKIEEKPGASNCFSHSQCSIPGFSCKVLFDCNN